jgi:hypothetical protein
MKWAFRAWDKKTTQWIYDGDKWAPEGYEAYYPVKITNHGVLFTNHIKGHDNYIQLYKDGKSASYYSDWENERLVGEDLDICIIEN